MRPALDFDLRSALRRTAAAGLALAVFAASGGAALVGQVCTHHGAASAAAEHDRHEPATAASHHQHGHGAPADDQPAESHADDGACTCLGACQTAATAETPATPVAARVPAIAAVCRATVVFELVPRSSQAAWFLPPSNGPPALT